MKYISCIVLMLLALQANATSVDTSGLTDKQRAELALQVVNMKAKVTVDTVEEVEKWANIGQSLGTGLAATANELGITANEFATTPVGMIAIVLIAWNYIGDSLMGLLFGFFWFSTTIPVWVWFYRSRFVVESVTYYDKGARDDGVRKVKDYRSGDADETTTHLFYWISLLLIVAVGTIAIF